jgi:hypothetical protein
VFILERKYAEEVGISEPYRSHKYEQYKELIDAYRNGREGTDVRGTPLQAWPRMTVSLVATAKAAGIYTVEALAALPDTRFAAFGPGARSLVEQAKAFCRAAAGNAPTEALAAENEQLRTDLADLRKQLADLSALMTAQQGRDPALRRQKVEDRRCAAPAPAASCGPCRLLRPPRRARPRLAAATPCRSSRG